MTDRVDTARAYYAALDDHAYDDLEALLDPAFVHCRPDRTIEGRDRFVAFMRDERPMTETAHDVGAVLDDGNDAVAVKGRLLDGEDVLFRFVDVVTIEDGSITEIETFTR